MDFLKRSYREVFGAIAVLVVVGVAVWLLFLDGAEESEETPDLVAIAEATLAARQEVRDAQSTVTALAPTPTSEPTPTPRRALAGICPADSFATELAAGIPDQDPAFTDWYGSEDSGLWAAPVNRAALVPGGMPNASSRWFASETMFVQWYGASEPLEITGEQLDGDASIEPVEPNESSGQIQFTNFTIPEPGCWRITGQAGEESLSVTVEVLSLDERPDMLFARRYMDARPYNPPASCAVDPWTGPEARGNHYIADYWLDIGEFSLNMWGWLAAGDEQWFAVNGEDIGDTLDVSARSLDSPELGRIEGGVLVRNQAVQGASLTFPEPGCWEVELTTPEATAKFVIYVYSEECAPSFEDGEILVSCEPPQT